MGEIPPFLPPGGSDFRLSTHGLAFAIGVFPRNSPKSVFSLGNTDRIVIEEQEEGELLEEVGLGSRKKKGT